MIAVLGGATLIHEITQDTFFKIHLFSADTRKKNTAVIHEPYKMSALRAWASKEHKTRHNKTVTLTHQEILFKNILTTEVS
jgi:hypothetical protein